MKKAHQVAMLVPLDQSCRSLDSSLNQFAESPDSITFDFNSTQFDSIQLNCSNVWVKHGCCPVVRVEPALHQGPRQWLARCSDPDSITLDLS